MKDRIVFVDYVRVIACFLVMLVHSSECFYCTSFDTAMLASESNRLWVSLYDGGIGRISVPLFMLISAFLLFTCIEQAEAPRWLTGLSKLTFGMYLMHLLFLNNIAPLIIGEDVANPIVPVALAIPCIAVLTFTCSALTTRLISLIPGSKWVIG